MGRLRQKGILFSDFRFIRWLLNPDVFWILGSVFGFCGCALNSGKCFWNLGHVFDSGKCFLESGMCLDSEKCLVLTSHRRFTCIVYMYDSVGKSIF